MILVTYAGPHDEFLDETIGVRLLIPMFKEYDNTGFRHISQIFWTTALWVYKKCAVNTRDGHLAYKIISYQFFGKNALENHDAA